MIVPKKDLFCGTDTTTAVEAKNVARSQSLHFLTGSGKRVARPNRRVSTILRAAFVVVCIIALLTGEPSLSNLVAKKKPQITGLSATNLAVTRPKAAVSPDASPRGWLPVDLGSAQISVPSGWYLGIDGGCATMKPPGFVFVGFTGRQYCNRTTRALLTVPAVYVASLRPGPVSGTKQKVNGVVIFRQAAGATQNTSAIESRYAVPSLDLTLTLVGSKAQRVLGTLTLSPRAVLLSLLSHQPELAVPRAWHWFSFSGLSFAAPDSWASQVTRWYGPDCQMQGVYAYPSATVIMSTDETLTAPSCVFDNDYGVFRVHFPTSGIRVDADFTRASGPTPTDPLARCYDTHDLRVCPYGLPDFGVLFLRIAGPGLARPIMFQLGLADAEATIRSIFGSLRPAGRGR